MSLFIFSVIGLVYGSSQVVLLLKKMYLFLFLLITMNGFHM
uniref:Uncharacterized protein n=1 Tax=Anguilla anguilla TaxID=7936 RepID=A0A0E9PS91_ANGAN